jgi:hypothetical protein
VRLLSVGMVGMGLLLAFVFMAVAPVAEGATTDRMVSFWYAPKNHEGEDINVRPGRTSTTSPRS